MGVRGGLVQDGLEQLVGLDVPPTRHNRLKRSPAGNTQATVKKAAQPIQQRLGRGVQTILQPPQRVGPYAFETVLAGSPVAGLPDPGRMGPRCSYSPMPGCLAGKVPGFGAEGFPCPGYDVAVRVEWASLMVCNSAAASSSLGCCPRSPLHRLVPSHSSATAHRPWPVDRTA